MNRLLSITRNTIPYIKELRPYAGSVAGCIIMQQLDFWFDRYPDGFYKFLQPCEHKAYRKGDSWTEEVGVSDEEFRTAFDRIGLRHPSKTAFEAADDKFQGKYYCSFHDKKQGLTFYFRNHAAVDALLDVLTQRHREEQEGVPVTVTWQRPVTENGDGELYKPDSPRSISTEINSDTKQTTQQNKKGKTVVVVPPELIEMVKASV